MNYEGRTRWKGHQDRQLVRIDSFVLKWSTKKVMISICQNRSFLRTGTSFITILIAVRRLKFIWCEISKLSLSKKKSEAVYIQRNILGLRLWVEHQSYVKLLTLLHEKSGIRRLSMSFKIIKKMNWIKLIWVEAESVANKIESTFHSKLANEENSFWLTRYDRTRTFEMIWSDFMMDPKHNDELLRTESSSNE